MKAVLSIAARLASTRLPRKVLADVGGRPILQLIIERLRPVNAEIVVANNGCDPEILDLCRRLGVRYVAAPVDVMAIHHMAMVESPDADLLLLAGADDPLLDPAVFNRLIARMERGDADYGKTTGLPLGLNVWAMTRRAMVEGHYRATAEDERQHVVPYWERRPKTYRKVVVEYVPDYYDAMRVTVDEPADLELIRRIYASLHGRPFDAEDVIRLLNRDPALLAINARGLHGTAARDAIYSIEPVEDTAAHHSSAVRLPLAELHQRQARTTLSGASQPGRPRGMT